jgi:hypothetical protein
MCDARQCRRGELRIQQGARGHCQRRGGIDAGRRRLQVEVVLQPFADERLQLQILKRAQPVRNHIAVDAGRRRKFRRHDGRRRQNAGERGGWRWRLFDRAPRQRPHEDD